MSARPASSCTSLAIPGLSDLPVRRAHPLRPGPPGLLSFALVAGVPGCSVPHARRADPPRGRRQPRLRACARLQGGLGALSGGPLRRRLRGPGRRLSLARLYAAMGGEHDRRARLDRAGAGRLRHLAALPGGRRRLPLRRGRASCSCTPRRSGLGVPSQFLSTLPYLITVLVLVIISEPARFAVNTPACLGQPFVPDR